MERVGYRKVFNFKPGSGSDLRGEPIYYRVNAMANEGGIVGGYNLYIVVFFDSAFVSETDDDAVHRALIRSTLIWREP